MKPRTQSELAYAGLKRAILECRLLPSARVKINDVCADYGVSLGAAREALSRLAAEGMVRMESQKGFTVAGISWDEFAQLMDTRVEIESYCLDHAIRNGDVAWESQVAAALHRLTRIHDQDEAAGRLPSAAWLAAHAEFHRVLVASCPNKCMLELREMLYARSERYRHWAVLLSLAVGLRNVRQEHIDIAEFALARNLAAARAVMHEHFTRTANDLLQAAREAEARGEQALPPYPQAANA